MLFKSFSIFFICINSFAATTTLEDKITLPLSYYAELGVYTTPIHVGKTNAQPIEAIIDTGSSSLVFVGSPEICPTCKNEITKGSVNPDALQQGETKKTINLTYGSANDKALEFLTPLTFGAEGKGQTKMKVFVLKDSTQPSSIMGLIHYNLREDQVDFVPFLLQVTENFNKFSDLTFILCADKGKSALHIGSYKMKEPPMLVSTRVPSKFYEIHTSGFYDKQGKPIIKTADKFEGAIIDTGTGGFIVLDPELFTPLHQYIFQHAGAANDKLDEKFWNENYCIIKKDVNFSAFPTVQIGFENAKTNQVSFLKLDPKTYLNRAGCDEGYVRLVFTKGLPPAHPTALRNHHERKAQGATPAMIIGTSLLSDYAMQIHFKDNPRIEFYDNKSLCHM
ncbi:Uncharacterised protein (plasmid) [Legionella adelaidensis]|uniref:Eukaryotic aspartyl protease n=1 Tax=Legionella adelaidensis TaxID=45056 RepID=A0A0W0R4W3_9GAMM|nr:hypothetical protein [Legionella adelaidensis]KTC66127.1 hypothetical protein Lade_0785 [Legionella adelaidensis]VEH85639.1 Uncharacterised protein [Legionella adelaidensis]